MEEKKELELICACNNCGTCFIDENPQTDTPKLLVNVFKLQPIQKFSVGENSFWGCPNCKTDDYLIDVDSQEQLDELQNKKDDKKCYHPPRSRRVNHAGGGTFCSDCGKRF